MGRQKPEELGLMVELNCLPSKRVIWIGNGQNDDDDSGVDKELSRKVVLALAYLDAEKDNPITLIINCIGGDFYDCISVYDAITSCRSYVRAIVCGQASSAAAIFLQAADERLITPHSWIMVHDGTVSFGHEGVADVKREYKQGARVTTQARQMLNIKAKLPNKKLLEILRRDTWLSANEAVAIGFADKVVDDWHANIG